MKLFDYGDTGTPDSGIGWTGSLGTQSIGLGGGPVDTLSSVGKTSVDLTNPAESAGGILGSIGSLVAPIPVVGQVVGAAGDVGRFALGKIGDIGVGGVGVKQTVGVAGDIVSGPGNWLQTQVGGARVAKATGKEGPSGVGGFLGNTLADFLGSKDNLELPEDLQQQLDAGVPVERIANQLADRNMGFESDPLWNTLDSIALDPFNVIAGGAGKAIDFGKESASLVTLKGASEVGLGTRYAGSAYNALTKGMSRASAVAAERALGPVTSGLVKGVGQEAMGSLGRLGTLDPAAAEAAQSALGVVNGNITISALAQEAQRKFGKVFGTISTDASRAEAATRSLEMRNLFGKARLSELGEEMVRLHSPAIPADAALRTEQTIANLMHVTGVTEDVARSVFAKGVSEGEWLLWRLADEGRSIQMLDAAKAKTIGTAAEKAAGMDARRVTLLSPETRARIDAVEKAIAEGTKAGKKGGQAWMRRVLADRPDLAEAFKEGAAKTTPEKLLKALQHERELLPSTFEKAVTGAHRLPEEIAKVKQWLGDRGYLLGFEPAGQLTADGQRVTALLADVGDGETILLRPWVAFSSDSLALAQRNPLGRVYDALFGGISQNRIISEAKSRLAQRGAKYGITQDDANRLVSRIYSSARENITTPRAVGTIERLGPDGNKVNEMERVFEDVLGLPRYTKMREAGLSPIALAYGAFEGNLATVGLSQKVTGAIKTFAAEHGTTTPVQVSEKAYQALKFNKNPLFWGQEMVEHPIWNALRGVNSWEKVDPSIRLAYETLLANNKAVRSVMEAGVSDMIGRSEVASRALGATSTIGRVADKLFPKLREGGLAANAEEQALRQVARDFPEVFRDAALEWAPDAWKAWADKLGTVDPRAISKAVVDQQLHLAQGQKGLAYEVQAIENAVRSGKLRTASIEMTPEVGRAERLGRALGERVTGRRLPEPAPVVQEGRTIEHGLMTAQEQSLWNAYVYAMDRVGEQAYKTHMFNPRRGALERTLNHPYLGMYPLSYMWGKVVPEFSRFLFYKPFGRTAPFAGYEAMRHVQTAITENMAADPAFADAIGKHEGLLFFTQLMLPATFTDIPVNAPAWARHLSQSAQGGKGFNIFREVQSGAQNIGVLRLPSLIEQATGSLGSDLSGLSDVVQNELLSQ